MRCKLRASRLTLAAGWALVSMTPPVIGQTALADINPAVCADLEADASDVLSDLGFDTEDELVSRLVVTAVLRRCAAEGAIDPPEGVTQGGTRAFGEVQGGRDEIQETLATEAEYYLTIAMGIDADAANDLLRRLLGPSPGDRRDSE